MSRAELLWVLKFVKNYEEVLEAYPELFKVEDIDDIKVVKQIVEEKLT